MSRLLDATICPDCRSPLDETATCTGCQLRLTGPLASRLWETMTIADRIVEQLRGVPAPAAAPAAAPVAEAAPLPAYPRSSVATPRRPVPGASVPVVLLSLGALCLLVAAVVFVAVAWGVLGLTGRTLVLFGVTTVLASVAVVLTRKALRGAAETMWLVVAGMVAVDLLGARSAGLLDLDRLDERGAATLLGGVLLALGVGVGLWARTQPVQRLYGAQAVGLAGAFGVTAAQGWLAENPAVGTTVALPVLVLLALALRRRLDVVSVGAATLTAITWVELALVGLDRAAEQTGAGTWWGDLRGWPLVAAAMAAAVAVRAVPAPPADRSGLAALALAPLAVLANSPLGWGSESTVLLLASATLMVLAAVTALAPVVVARGAGALAALMVLGLAGTLAVPGWLAADGLPWGSAPLDLSVGGDGTWAAWIDGVLAVAIAVAVACLVRLAARREQMTAAMAAVPLATAALGLGATSLVLQLTPPLWAAVLTTSLVCALLAGVTWNLRDLQPASWLGSAATAYFAALTLVLAVAADLLAAIVASVACVALAAAFTLRDRAGAATSSTVMAVLATLAGGYALGQWGVVLDADPAARALALAVYAGLAAVLAAPVSLREQGRVAVEVGATMVAVAAVGGAHDSATLAMVLTVLGTALAIVAITQRDRALASWMGVAVLGGATLIRVIDDVRAPELYTLPAAALLVAAGVWRLRTDRETSSVVALGSGLTLALLPSLLLSLDEPVSVRGALTAVASVLVLAAGVQQRLTAPLVLGAGSTALLAVRHLEPYADAVPRWVSLGLLGLALLAVGISWESRMRDLRSAQRYLTALR